MEHKKEIIKECRFYEKELPDEGDLVVVSMKEVNEHSVIVQLLEFDKIEAMITQAEYSRTRKTKYGKGFLKVKTTKKKDVCQVIRGDKEKRNFDLSKKKIAHESKKEAEMKFEKGKKVQNLFYSLCGQFQKDMIYFYELIVFPLQKDGNHAFDIFHKAIFEFETIMDPLNIPEKIKQAFKIELKKKFTPKPIKVNAIFELKSYSKEGIEDIKNALRLGKSKSSENIKLEINLVSPPKYIIQTKTIDKKKGVRIVNNALDAIKEYILEKGGKFDLKESPNVIGGKEKAIQELLNENYNETIIEDNDEGMGTQDLEEDFDN